MSHVFDRLIDATRAARSRVCVGLDPHLELLPPDEKGKGPVRHVRDFLFEVLAAVERIVPCVKPQIAFFEALGPEGYALYFDVIREAHRRGLFVIGDIKRADIGSTAAAYAKAHLAADDGSAADAVTLNPYLGLDGIEPFLKVGRTKGRGVFVLARTSNPSAKEFQGEGGAGAREGEPLYMKVGRALERWGAARIGERGYGDVGAVVGATYPAELAQLRAAMPEAIFLVPGFGAQGGTADDVRAAFRADGLGAVVNSSRGVLFPFRPDEKDWEAKVERAAREAAAALAVRAG